MGNNEKYLTTAEAAKLLRISIKTLYAYIELRIIPHLRVRANRVLFDREQLEQWLRSKLVKPEW